MLPKRAVFIYSPVPVILAMVLTAAFGTTSAHRDTWGKNCRSTSDCSIAQPDFTVCDTTKGVCVCLQEVEMEYDPDLKSCIRNGTTWGTSCTGLGQCSPRLPDYTVCNVEKSLCVCANGDGMYHDKNLNTCLVYADQPCTGPGSYLPCVEQAECSLAFPVDLCKCTGDYVAEDGFCGGSHGAPCSPTLACIKEKGLTCVNGACTCPEEGVSYEWSEPYKDKFGYCVGLSGTGHCVQDKDCTPGAGCTYGTCQCQSPYSSLINRRCKLGNNEPCVLNPDDPWDTCNEDAGLICALSRCYCKEGTVYEGPSSKCVGMVEAECDLVDNPFSKSCVQNAKCVAAEGSPEGKGVCECSSGFSPSSDKASCTGSRNFGVRSTVRPKFLVLVLATIVLFNMKA